METVDSQAVIQTISMVALAVIALIYGINKLRKDWHADDTEANVMELMHSELSRMSAQNKVLSEELGRMQHEMISLNNQIRQLCIDNDRLQCEVAALTAELSKLSIIGAEVADATSQT